MKKRTQIYIVNIDGQNVSAMDQNCDTIKLTRSQRSILSNYKNSDYIENIKKEWHNDHVIHPDFTVTKNGKIVYTYTK